jgi:hypothetical protein
MEWFEAAARVSPYVVKIETPAASGTGFLCLYTKGKLSGVATADHVIAEADRWEQPMRMIHSSTGGQLLLKPEQRVVFRSPDNDSAVIVFTGSTLGFPDDLLPLLPANQRLKLGVAVAWLGYPSVGGAELCFFTGSISAYQKNAYFIDGVAINGVSGGPVFDVYPADTARIIGTLSAYRYNLAGGTALPGLSFAQDVTYLHNTISVIESMDDAREKQKEEQEKARRAGLESRHSGGDAP